MRPPPIIVVRSIFLLTGIRSRRARTRSSSPGTVYRLTPFLLFPSFPESSRSSGNLGGRSSLLWLRTGLSALGSRTCSSCRWPLLSFFPTVPTSCACLDLGLSTRVSASSGLMPGDSPVVHQGCGILLDCSGAVFSGAPPILSRYISASLFCLQILVPRTRPFDFSAFFGEGGRFPLLVVVYQGP